MRSTAGMAALGAQGQCTTTAIAMEFGQKNDPGVEARTAVIKDWIYLWMGQKQSRSCLVKTWYKLKEALSGPYRWRRVRGPVAATMATLRDLGWDPFSPIEWKDPDGQAWKFNDDGGDGDMFFEDFQKHIMKQHWRRASQWLNGGGLQNGASIAEATRKVTELRQKDLPDMAAVLQKAAAAATWTRTRRKEAGYDIDSICALCGEGEHDEFHRIWDCSVINSSERQGIRDSNHIIPKAMEERHASPCF